MRTISTFAAAVGLGLGIWGNALAQPKIPDLPVSEQPFDFAAAGDYAPAVPVPDALLGYAVGSWHAQYGQFEQLLATYAALSPRISARVLGQTPERRAMYEVIITSPRNHARLAQIQANNQKLADPRQGLNGRALQTALQDQPIIVWLAYNIHGDESAGTEAAMRVLYHFAAARGTAVDALLEQVVIVMNPCQNPDGRERFVVWSNAHAIDRPESFAFEKSNPWNVQGRYNHNYFDLNRDMLAISQPESRISGANFLAWLPQVAVDHHGETKEYFFPPAALPINPNLDAAATTPWLEIFGQANATAFDAQGWMYYTRDVFDLFYPGYWDSWPGLLGATGMTYETSGGGKQGRVSRRDDETLRGLRAAIAQHFTASLTTVRTAAAHREDRLRSFRQFYENAFASGRTGAVQQVFLLPGRDPARTAAVGQILRRHGVELQQLAAAQMLPTASDYFGNTLEAQTLPAGTWLIDMAQPQAALARALLEPHTPQDEAFLERQAAKRRRNEARGSEVASDGYEFYDITAWSLPLLFGVDAYYTNQPISVTSAPVAQVNAPAVAAPERASVAYVWAPGPGGAVRVALQLMAEGYRVAAASRPLSVGTQNFPAGALIARVGRNPATLHARIAALAVGQGVTVHAANTAFPTAGNTGLGSEDVHALKPAKIAVATGPGTEPSGYGALRFWLETVAQVEFVPVSLGSLGEMDLSGFNIVLIPDGVPAQLQAELGEAGPAHLKAWAESGGTLICLGGATVMAADEQLAWTSARPRETVEVVPSVASAGEGEATVDLAAALLATDDEKPEPLPIFGSIFAAVINHDHYLTFGLDGQEQLPVLVSRETFLEPSTTGTNVLSYGGTPTDLSGFVWPDNSIPALAGTSELIDEPVGSGHIVLFAGEPGFRAIWQSANPLLLNALLYGPAFSAAANTYFAE